MHNRLIRILPFVILVIAVLALGYTFLYSPSGVRVSALLPQGPGDGAQTGDMAHGALRADEVARLGGAHVKRYKHALTIESA